MQPQGKWREGDANLGGLLAVVVNGSDGLINSSHLTVVSVDLLQSVTTRLWDEAAQRVVRVVVPDAVIVVTWTHGAAAL